MNKIKREDTVKVLTGSYKGESGRVIKILTAKNRVIVEGINKAKKHVKPTQDNPQGGIVEKELSINLSNLALMSKGKVVKVGFQIDKDGKRFRINKKNGNKID
jgi:large subunit ribosomal protein L24